MWKLNDKEFESLDELIKFVDSEAFTEFTENEFKKGLADPIDQILFCVTNTDSNVWAVLTIADHRPSIWHGNEKDIKNANKGALYEYGFNTILDKIDERLEVIYPDYNPHTQNESNSEDLVF